MERTLQTLQEPKVPKYWTLIEHLRGQIDAGFLQPGSRVPSLAEMQNEFNVSRATVEKAYTLLEQDGVLVREQGRGTFVTDFSDIGVSTGLIGLIVLTRNPYHPYVLHLLSGIRAEAKLLGLEVLWLDEGESIPWEKVDGVLMYLGKAEVSNLQLPPSMPCVSVLRRTEGMTSVTADDFSGAKMAVEHLLELGHRRIATVQSTPDDYFSLQHLAGYREALSNAGVQADERWVNYIYDHVSRDYLETGKECMSRWLENDWPSLNCTALLAANDEAAIGIIKAFAEKGIRVPEDVSVVGFDGLEASAHSTPRLTTIEVPLREIGMQGMCALQEQIQGGTTEIQNFILPARLKLGNSSAPFASVRRV